MKFNKSDFEDYMKVFLEQNSKLNLISKMMRNFFGKNIFLTALQFQKYLKNFQKAKVFWTSEPAADFRLCRLRLFIRKLRFLRSTA